MGGFYFQFLSTPTQSQNLKVTNSAAKLPAPSYIHRLWYNGEDDIYIFGTNSGSGYAKTILKYSLSTDSIQTLGSLPVSVAFGSLHSDGDGNIFYFGGKSRNNKV